MALREKLYTAEEFFEIAALPENDAKRLELDDGEIVEIAESSATNTVTAMRIGTFLNIYVMTHNLGYVTGADGGFKLAERRVRQPDVGFISKTRVPKLPKRFQTPPDLAVELVSPDEDIFKKALEYLHAGTKIVWAVYTEEKIVHVMRLDDDGGLKSKPFDMSAVLDGGDVLPGFTLPVKDIFPD